MPDAFTAMFTTALDALDGDVAAASEETLRARLADELRVKRAVVDQHQQTCGSEHLCVTCHVPYPCPTLRLHASPFEGRPDFDSAWLIPRP